MYKLDKEFLKFDKILGMMSRQQGIILAENHKKVLDELRVRLVELYEAHEIQGKLTFDEISKYGRLKKLDAEIEKTIKELYKTNSKLIGVHLGTIASETYINTIEIVEKATGRKLLGIVKEVDVSKTINNEMAGLRWSERMGKHRADTIWNIQKEIKQGLTQGDTYGTMAKRLKKELEISASKANVIIRTEGHRVQAQAKSDSLDSISKHGIKMTKKWLSAKDERVRSEHSAMDGVVVPYDEDFILPDGARGKAPGLIGEPQHDINCRCIITIDVVKDEKDISEPEFIRISNETEGNKYTVKVINSELDLIPNEHKKILENTVKEITIVNQGNSRYDRRQGIVYILENPVEGEVIHELAHAIETELDLWNNDEFLNIVLEALEGKTRDDIVYDAENFVEPIWLVNSDTFVSLYQGKLYQEAGFYHEDKKINPKALGEYFSEGYREFIESPMNLKKKNKNLYEFIRDGVVKIEK